jgi:hypothetical protein
MKRRSTGSLQVKPRNEDCYLRELPLARSARPALTPKQVEHLAEFGSKNKSGKKLLKHRAPLGGTRGECLDIVAGDHSDGGRLAGRPLQCPPSTKK